MDSPRKAEGGFGVQLLGENRAAGIDKIPGSTLEQHVAGVIADFALLAAHHACQGQRAGGIANHDGEIIQLAFHPIQRFQLLALLCRAGDDGGWFPTRALQQDIVIEGMQRLTELEHDVIGGIHDAIDRAHARQAQAHLDLVGAGARLNTTDQAKDKPRIQRWIGDIQGRFAINARAGDRQPCLRFAQRFAQDTQQARAPHPARRHRGSCWAGY